MNPISFIIYLLLNANPSLEIQIKHVKAIYVNNSLYNLLVAKSLDCVDLGCTFNANRIAKHCRGLSHRVSDL